MKIQDKTQLSIKKEENDVNNPEYLKELESKADSFIDKALDLKQHDFYEHYKQALFDLDEALKDACIREQDIERIRGYQSQHGLLMSILNITEGVSDPT